MILDMHFTLYSGWMINSACSSGPDRFAKHWSWFLDILDACARVNWSNWAKKRVLGTRVTLRFCGAVDLCELLNFFHRWIFIFTTINVSEGRQIDGLLLDHVWLQGSKSGERGNSNNDDNSWVVKGVPDSTRNVKPSCNNEGTSILGLDPWTIKGQSSVPEVPTLHVDIFLPEIQRSQLVGNGISRWSVHCRWSTCTWQMGERSIRSHGVAVQVWSLIMLGRVNVVFLFFFSLWVCFFK